MLTLERLKSVLRYDPETGRWTNLVTRARARAGDEAGNRDAIGRHRIMLDGVHYRSSRLAYLYMKGEWPPHQIDHKNGDATDDRWENLRPATNQQNGWNTKPYNRIGLKGVVKKRRQYQARIFFNGKLRHLGFFPTAQEAHDAYKLAALEHFGEFARFD